jgi:hypothetical protein
MHSGAKKKGVSPDFHLAENIFPAGLARNTKRHKKRQK